MSTGSCGLRPSLDTAKVAVRCAGSSSPSLGSQDTARHSRTQQDIILLCEDFPMSTLHVDIPKALHAFLGPTHASAKKRRTIPESETRTKKLFFSSFSWASMACHPAQVWRNSWMYKITHIYIHLFLKYICIYLEICGMDLYVPVITSWFISDFHRSGVTAT